KNRRRLHRAPIRIVLWPGGGRVDVGQRSIPLSRGRRRRSSALQRLLGGGASSAYRDKTILALLQSPQHVVELIKTTVANRQNAAALGFVDADSEAKRIRY